MAYKIFILPAATKALGKLTPITMRSKIVDAIGAVADNPRPAGGVKLMARGNRYRIRVGDFRVLYEIDDGAKHAPVVHIGNRKDVYR